MDITKMLRELKSEREGVEQAILVLDESPEGVVVVVGVLQRG